MILVCMLMALLWSAPALADEAYYDELEQRLEELEAELEYERRRRERIEAEVEEKDEFIEDRIRRYDEQKARARSILDG